MLESLKEYEKEYNGEYDTIARLLFSELEYKELLIKKLSEENLELNVIEKHTILRAKDTVEKQMKFNTLIPHVLQTLTTFINDNSNKTFEFLEIEFRLTNE